VYWNKKGNMCNYIYKGVKRIKTFPTNAYTTHSEAECQKPILKDVCKCMFDGGQVQIDKRNTALKENKVY